MALVVKNLPANARDTGDAGLIPGSGRCPGEGNGNPLQYFCLGNPMDRGAWRATVHRVTNSRTQLKCLACMQHAGHQQLDKHTALTHHHPSLGRILGDSSLDNLNSPKEKNVTSWYLAFPQVPHPTPSQEWNLPNDKPLYPYSYTEPPISFLILLLDRNGPPYQDLWWELSTWRKAKFNQQKKGNINITQEVKIQLKKIKVQLVSSPKKKNWYCIQKK